VGPQPNVTSLGTLTGLNVAGTSSIQQAKEKITRDVSGASGTVNYDILTQAILYSSGNATANFTINIRGNSTISLNTVMNSNESMTCTYIATNTSPAYYANVISIDGTVVTPKWVSPGAPAGGTPNAQDVYTFNILKIAANTYNVLGSKTGFL
jgi:hypothetical protein